MSQLQENLRNSREIARLAGFLRDPNRSIANFNFSLLHRSPTRQCWGCFENADANLLFSSRESQGKQIKIQARIGVVFLSPISFDEVINHLVKIAYLLFPANLLPTSLRLLCLIVLIFNYNMLNEIFKEAQRTFFICGIHLIYLLCLNPESPCEKQKAEYSKLTGLSRLIVNFFDQATFFMCHYFIPYAGYLVIALQYWFLINVIYNWFFPSLVRGLRNGTFGDSDDDYSVQNDKRLMRELRKMIVLIFEGLFGTVNTSLSPLEIHFLRTWELSTVRKKEHDTWDRFIHPTVSLLYNSHDPRSEFLRFGTAYDGVALSLVISDEKFSRKKDFFLFAMKWTTDMIQGVRYLHDQDLYHLNLQSENILVNFGPKFLPISSKAIIGNFQSRKNTLVKCVPFGVIGFESCHKPPEAFLSTHELPKKADAEKRDIWGIGIIVLELLTGGMLTVQTKHYFAFNRMNVLAHMLQSNNFFLAVEAAHGDEISNDFLLSMELGQTDEQETTGADIDEDCIWSWWVLVKDLLKFDPSVRIGIREACQHDFVKKGEDVLSLEVIA